MQLSVQAGSIYRAGPGLQPLILQIFLRSWSAVLNIWIGEHCLSIIYLMHLPQSSLVSVRRLLHPDVRSSTVLEHEITFAYKNRNEEDMKSWITGFESMFKQQWKRKAMNFSHISWWMLKINSHTITHLCFDIPSAFSLKLWASATTCRCWLSHIFDLNTNKK